MTISTGVSALRAHQTALSVTGNNIANASTEGFRREQVLFVENPHVEQGGFSIGTGVSIGEIRRVGDAALESALMDSESNGGMLAARLQNAKRIESLFLPGTGMLQERLEELFLNLERLSALPTDNTLRNAVLHSASGLADEVNRVADALESMSAATDAEIERTIGVINETAAAIADLNRQIIATENTGREAHGLRNQRDLLLKDLSQLIDVERRLGSDGRESFFIGGGLYSIERGLSDMQLIRNESGRLETWKEGCDQPHEVEGGKLAGLLAQINDAGGIGDLKNQISDFTAALAQFMDAAHATGVGIGGAFNSLVSGRRVDDPVTSLANQKTITPIVPGSLYVSVNDEESGEIVVSEISVDPQAQSLNDFANLLGTVDHISASVDSLGRISVVADAGFSFDFTGNLQTRPTVSALASTAVPTISGRYRGTANDTFTFRFIGSGTVGVTEGLQLEVTDESNLTIRVLDIGRSYEPLSNLIVGDGVNLSLSPGTAVDGEAFVTKLPGQPDESGILTALGLNTLFVGNAPGSIQVNPDLLAKPSLLATTTNGDPSDTRNLHRMLQLRDARVMREGTVTLEQFLAEVVADAGQEVGELTRDVEGHAEQHAFLQSEFDAITAVDVNEELARMLQYQRSYQAAARYIATVDQMLQELFSIIR